MNRAVTWVCLPEWPYNIGPEHLTFIATSLAVLMGLSRCLAGTGAPNHVEI